MKLLPVSVMDAVMRQHYRPPIPNRLREARKAAGLTQEALAVRVGVAQGTIARWESDQVEPLVRNAVRIAQALDTTPDKIWPCEPEPQEQR